MQEIHYPQNLAVTYGYDLCGRVVRVSWGTHFYSRSYDASGRVIRESRSNGTESLYEYDPTGVFTRIYHSGRAGVIADLSYRWDAAGNIIEKSGTIPHAASSRSASAGTPPAVSFNSENQLLLWGSRRFVYDNDGNRTGAEGAGQAFSAEYDTENRPVRISTPQQSTEFVYNGMGDLVRMTGGGQDIRDHYTPEGWLAFRSTGNGTLCHSFIYCEGRLIAMVRPGGDTLFFHFDNTGNTLALTGSSGNTVGEYAYDEFGSILETGGDICSNPFTYAGEFGVIDVGDNLFFMRHRFYDANTGIFLQKDPIGHRGGINLYGYVGANPVTRVDPAGTGGGVIFCCLLVTVAVAGYTIYCSAKKFGDQNPITRTLQVSQQANAGANKKNAQTVSKDEFFNDPDHGMVQVMTTSGDQYLTANPVTNPGWSLMKGMKSAAEGKPVDAALNTLSAFPDGMKVISGPGKNLSEVHEFLEIDVGSLFTAGGQVKSICTDPPPGR
jgi:RHS repeat-associated protein